METRKWDFLSALGDTTSERFESLYRRLVKIIEEDLDGSRCVTFIANPEVTSFFETAIRFEASAISCSMGEINYAGFFNSVNINFYVYKTPYMPQNQAILIGNEKSVCLEIDNLIT